MGERGQTEMAEIQKDTSKGVQDPKAVSKGPYTPAKTPVDMGNMTQGEYDFKNASATPQAK
jgi:hypothetical protein